MDTSPLGSRLDTWLRAYALRALLAASLVLGLFWTAGVVIEDVQKQTLEHPWLLFLLSAGVVALGLRRLFAARPEALVVPAQVSPGWLGVRLVAYTLAAYLALMPLCGLLGRPIVISSWPDHHSQAGLYKFLMALWLPLWWAPGVAALAAGRWSRKGTSARTNRLA
jgi:hypothetical protein